MCPLTEGTPDGAWGALATLLLILQVFELAIGFLGLRVLAFHRMADNAGERVVVQRVFVSFQRPLLAVDVGVEDGIFVAAGDGGFGVHPRAVQLALGRGAGLAAAAFLAKVGVELVGKLIDWHKFGVRRFEGRFSVEAKEIKPISPIKQFTLEEWYEKLGCMKIKNSEFYNCP